MTRDKQILSDTRGYGLLNSHIMNSSIENYDGINSYNNFVNGHVDDSCSRVNSNSWIKSNIHTNNTLRSGLFSNNNWVKSNIHTNNTLKSGLFSNNKMIRASISNDSKYEELKALIDNLQRTKMDRDYDYVKQDNTIQFYANGEPAGEKIYLDDEVHWEGWGNEQT